MLSSSTMQQISISRNNDSEQRKIHIEALRSFAEQVEPDPHIVALLLTGSLSYGTVWEKSDIDMNLIVRDGSVPKDSYPNYCIEENGVDIHLEVVSVSDFKRGMQRLRGGDFIHGYFGYGKFVFTKDASLEVLLEDSRIVGENDAKITFIDNADFLLVHMNRASKWVTAIDNPLYSQRFLAPAALIAAEMVLLRNGEEPNRESMLRAAELDPDFILPLYQKPLTTKMTSDEVRGLIAHLESYIERTLDWWSSPIIEYLSDGEPCRVSQIIKHFRVHNMDNILSFLADRGIVNKLTQPSQLFKRSSFNIEEVSYMITDINNRR